MANKRMQSEMASRTSDSLAFGVVDMDQLRSYHDQIVFGRKRLICRPALVPGEQRLLKKMLVDSGHAGFARQGRLNFVDRPDDPSKELITEITVRRKGEK